jgi:signal peptidase II
MESPQIESAPAPAPMPASVWGRPTLREHLLLFVVATIALAIDQVSKRLIETNIAPGEAVAPIAALGQYFTLTNTQNSGAAFSLFQNGAIFFVIVAIIVSGLIVYYAPRLPKGERLSRLALGLQLGGALGNLVDRLRHQGYVTDFLHFQIPQISFNWPVSNVADICIVGGVIILLLASFRLDHASGKPAGQEGEAVAE